LIVIDTCVILKYALDEDGSDRIDGLLNKIRNQSESAIMPSTVLTELFAILTKRNLKEIAIEIEEHLIDSGVEVIPVNRDMAVLAGFLKAKYATAQKGFSYNDAIILALAIEYDASICTYDSEFDRVTEVEVKTP